MLPFRYKFHRIISGKFLYLLPLTAQDAQPQTLAVPPPQILKAIEP